MNNKNNEKTADTFFALGHVKRVCILEALLKQLPRNMTFGELQKSTRIAPSTLSHHLREMENGNVILQKPEGVSTKVELNLSHLQKILADLMSKCCKNS